MRNIAEFSGVIRWSPSGSRTAMRVATAISVTSRMNLGGKSQVEANGLHDPEGRAGGEYVGRGEHAGVLLDHGGCGPVRARVEATLHAGPSVLPVLHEEGSRIDRGERLPDAGVNVSPCIAGAA